MDVSSCNHPRHRKSKHLPSIVPQENFGPSGDFQKCRVRRFRHGGKFLSFPTIGGRGIDLCDPLLLPLNHIHHPFTAPVSVDEMRETPETAVAQAYDLVLNGSELGSGSVRIHDPGTQRAVFEILGISDEEAESRFGWFLDALGYGTPPHAGFAIGIDRLVAILQNETSIREVIPFPKTQSGADPLTTAPTRVVDAQLDELGLDLSARTRALLATSGRVTPAEPPDPANS